jgi:negative regulator of genetic competence, sporulation and motility
VDENNAVIENKPKEGKEEEEKEKSVKYEPLSQFVYRFSKFHKIKNLIAVIKKR